MADARKFELDELVNRPGTYFNPQTEVLVVVDDSPELDSEIFNMEEFEGADWVLISDEIARRGKPPRRAAGALPGSLPPGLDHRGRTTKPTTSSRRTTRRSGASSG